MLPGEGQLNPETLLSHFAEEEKLEGAVTPPIFQNSLFVFDRVEDLMAAMANYEADAPHVYSRSSNPTVQVVERKLAALEGTDGCLLTGGGIAAISMALTHELEAGSHAIMVDTAYGPARSFLRYMTRFGVSHTLVEGVKVEDFADEIRPETRVIYLESPSSMLFKLQDVPRITEIARQKGITTIFDNTYNTPLHMRPIEFGADVVLHSASKYLGGHSDLIAGAICTDRVRIQSMMRSEVAYYGFLLHPFSAWLMLRGMRTLSVRVRQHERTANEIAAWLEGRPEVERVHHISLDSYPQRELYRRLMKGSTGLFSFEPKVQDRDRVYAFTNALKLFGRGVSWGGFESLVIPTLVAPAPGQEKRWVVRLFCGLEATDDLRRDLEQALNKFS